MKRPRWLRRILFRLAGAALLPVAAVEALACVALVRSLQVTHEALAFGIGFFFWIILFHSLPRPFRAYILAHELSHAIWGFFSGSSVSGLRVSRRGGSVRISDVGLFATLAPYFLPLYSILLLALYGAVALFAEPAPWKILWMAAFGASWGFHISFTLAIVLETQQPDLREYGRFFSAVLIVILHLAIFFAALALLLSASAASAIRAFSHAWTQLQWVAWRIAGFF